MILQWCLWGLAAYGVTCLLLLLLRKWNWIRITPREVHVMLLSYNSQHSIEWTLRSILMWSWLEGRSYLFTIVDGGSTDDTLPIIARLQRGYMNLNLIQTDIYEMDQAVKKSVEILSEEHNRLVIMDLRRQDEVVDSLSSNA